jgi:hypothetical protein
MITNEKSKEKWLTARWIASVLKMQAMRTLSHANRVKSAKFARLWNSSRFPHFSNEYAQDCGGRRFNRSKPRLATGVAKSKDARVDNPKRPADPGLSEVVRFLKEELPRCFLNGVRF